MRRQHRINRFLIALLGSTSILGLSLLAPLKNARGQDFTGIMTTSGPFASGTQNFYDDSIFDANIADAATGSAIQTFHDDSSLIASAANAVSGGSQSFYDNSWLYATATGAVTGGDQYFGDPTGIAPGGMEVLAADAILGGTQNFDYGSHLNAMASHGINGVQNFAHGATLYVGAADAVNNGSSQEFFDDSKLDLIVSSGISDGLQIFHDTSTLNIVASNGLIGGQQTFDGNSALNANAALSIGGTSQQSFDASSVLNANASDAVSNGQQTFHGNSVLTANAAQAVSGGSQRFYDNSKLVAAAADSVSGFEDLNDNSVLEANVADAVGGATVRLFNNATLQVNADNAVTSTSVIYFNDINGGPGGILQLNGHSTDVGGFESFNVSSAPTGIIRNGGTSDATLTLDDSAAAGTWLFNGIIEDGGPGALNLRRAGTTGVLYLVGPNTYTGATIIDGGTLGLFGSGSIASSSNVELNSADAVFDISAAAGDVTIHNLSGVSNSNVTLGINNLIIDNTYDTVFGGAINGTGGITKQGSGTLTFNPMMSYDGPTHVIDGRLAVNGAITNSVITVDHTGVLGGTGQVIDIIAGAGGTIAPGNSIGTLTVFGNAAFNAGSIYQVEVNAAGQSDLLGVSGVTTLDAGSMVRVLAASGDYTNAAPYTILTSLGGFTGTFGGVSANFVFLTPSLSYDATHVYLTLTQNGNGFASVAKTRNQRAAATGAGSLQAGDPVYDQILGLDAASAQAAYDSLSGEVHAAVSGQMLRDARYVSDAVASRLQQADRLSGNAAAQEIAYLTPLDITTAAGSTDTLAIWGQAFGGWSEVDGNGNAGQLDRSLAGFLVGVDRQIAENWRLGLAAGYSHSDLDLSDRRSNGDIDSFHLALYGGGHLGPVALRLGAAYSFNDVDTRRDASAGTLNEHDKANYNAHMAQVFGEIGYDAKIGPVALEPFAGMAYAHLNTDSFEEKGGATALHGKSDEQDMPYSTLGLRIAGEVAQIGGGALTAHGMLGWRHAYGDITPTADLAFDGGDNFSVAGAPIARNALVAQAGLDLAVTDRVSAGISYDGQIAGSAHDNAVQGNLVWKF
jgi:outer membrane autotransporter protein